MHLVERCLRADVLAPPVVAVPACLVIMLCLKCTMLFMWLQAVQASQQQRRQAPAGKAQLLDDDFTQSQRPHSAARSAAAKLAAAAKRQGNGTPGVTPGRSAQPDAKGAAAAQRLGSAPARAAGVKQEQPEPAARGARKGSQQAGSDTAALAADAAPKSSTQIGKQGMSSKVLPLPTLALLALNDVHQECVCLLAD